MGASRINARLYWFSLYIHIYIIWCASADERISLANVIKKDDSQAFCHLFLAFYIQKDVVSLQKRRKRVMDMTPQGKNSS